MWDLCRISARPYFKAKQVRPAAIKDDTQDSFYE